MERAWPSGLGSWCCNPDVLGSEDFSFLLLLRTNKPMRINFLSILLEDFRSPREMVFRLKITHLKSAGDDV